MSTPQLGMDPDQIERIGRDLQAASADLERIGVRLGGAVERTTGRWTGPDALMFQDRWREEQRARLNALVADIGGLGQTALTNADAQRRVSADLGLGGAGTGGPGAGHGGAGSGSGEHRSPGGIEDMLDFEHRGDVDSKDGLRIQVGIGPDGRRKVIVYIAGTGGDDQGRLSLLNNMGAVGGDSVMAAYVRERLAGLVDDQTDVLFIGYSQGGLVAEDVARDSGYGSAMVISEAAPPLGGPRGDVDIVRLNSRSVVNDVIGLPNSAADRLHRMTSPGDYGAETGLERTHLTESDRGSYQQILSGIGNPNPFLRGMAVGKGVYAGIEDHMDHDLYREAGGAFMRSDHPDDVALQQKLGGFTGIDLLYDSDVKALDDRDAVLLTHGSAHVSA